MGRRARCELYLLQDEEKKVLTGYAVAMVTYNHNLFTHDWPLWGINILIFLGNKLKN